MTTKTSELRNLLLAAAPVFGSLTDTKVTDHRGQPYALLDAGLEAAKYKTKKHEAISSSVVVVAKEPYHSAIVNALHRFGEQLDLRQKPGLRGSF